MHVIDLLSDTSFDHSNCVPDATDFFYKKDKTSVMCLKTQDARERRHVSINYCWHRRLSDSGFFSSKKITCGLTAHTPLGYQSS